ncbi:hypothetical protein J1605_003401 [Eschrichtius robustus]|uniref:Uncharacterized protein n=1 Tax=Eschrichtius robustus TaxID=9764 RepID=A0AB34HMH1_ESCRO|nr:hypothetical protein J1605_003401 [Eschrichtius robustus]
MVKGVAQGCRRVQQKAALQAVLPVFTSRQLRGPRFDAADTVGTELGWVAQCGEGPAPFWGGWWEPRQALPWGLPGGRQALPAHWPWREQLPRRHPSRHARSARHHVRSASRPRNTEVAGVVMSCSESESEEKVVTYDHIGPSVCMGDHKPVFLAFRMAPGAGKPHARKRCQRHEGTPGETSLRHEGPRPPTAASTGPPARHR